MTTIDDLPVSRGYTKKLTFELFDIDNGDEPFALQPDDDVVFVVRARDRETEVLRKTRADMTEVSEDGVTSLQLDLSAEETKTLEIGRVNTYEIGLVRGDVKLPLRNGFIIASLRGV